MLVTVLIQTLIFLLIVCTASSIAIDLEGYQEKWIKITRLISFIIFGGILITVMLLIGVKL